MTTRALMPRVSAPGPYDAGARLPHEEAGLRHVATYPGQVPITCDACGGARDEEQPPLTWSLSVERGRVQRYCEPCTRQNLRDLEGKLDLDP